MGIIMSKFFKRDDELDELVSSKDTHQLHDVCDSAVTITYGGDGVTLPEVFDSGASLVRDAGDRDIWLAWDTERRLMFFFIGALNDIIEKIKPLKEATPECLHRGSKTDVQGGGQTCNLCGDYC